MSDPTEQAKQQEDASQLAVGQGTKASSLGETGRLRTDFPPPKLQQQRFAAPTKSPSGFGRGFGAGFGFALGVGVIITVSSIISSIMMIGMLALLRDTPAGRASTQLSTVWGSDSAENKLRAIDISGPIMADGSDGGVFSSGTYGYEVADMIYKMKADDAGALLLLVNTPGGSVPGSAAIANAVEDYKTRTGKPVLVHVSSLSASGGVYSTSTATEIWADEGSIVGSIGVVMGPISTYTNVTEIGSTLLTPGVTAEKIEQQYIYAGKGKVFGNPFVPVDPDVKAQYEEMIQESYKEFVGRMVAGRGMDADIIRNEMGAGVFGTEKAQEYKLIDGVKNREEFFKYAAEKAGFDSSNTRVEKVVAPAGFASLLGAKRAYGVSLPVEQGPGITPKLSEAMCGGQAVLAYHGKIAALCG